MFVNESRVDICDHATVGRWNSTDEGLDFQFSVAHNLRRARIDISAPDVEGTFYLDSIAPPRYPAGEIYPSSTADLALAPLIYWNEAIPAGTLRANFVLSGLKFELDGYGFFDKNWGPYIWDAVSESWYWSRMVVGPYVVVFWTFTSAIDHQVHTSAFLSENEEEIFATRNVTASDGVYATQTLLYGGEGGVRGNWADASTGIAFDFVDGSKSWHFDITHTLIELETPLESNYNYSRFVNTATGGEVGGKVWSGAANSEQMVIRVVQPIP